MDLPRDNPVTLGLRDAQKLGDSLKRVIVYGDVAHDLKGFP